MAIATAVIAATSLFGSFEVALVAAGDVFEGVRVNFPNVLVGLLIGGSVAFLFSSLLIRAVGRAASQVVVEVRNQFREHPGIMDYSEKPDYARVVDICTRTSLRELMTPGLLAVLSPVIVGFFLKAEALGAFLAGASSPVSCWPSCCRTPAARGTTPRSSSRRAITAARDSEAHKATVIGDTVGDPFKDTAGPALNPMIKVINLVPLLIAPLVVKYADDNVVRITIGMVALVILADSIWYAKSRRTELMVEAPEASSEPAPATRP